MKRRRRNRNSEAENNGISRIKKHVSGGSKVGHGLEKSGKRKETALHVEISCLKRSRLASNEVNVL